MQVSLRPSRNCGSQLLQLRYKHETWSVLIPSGLFLLIDPNSNRPFYIWRLWFIRFEKPDRTHHCSSCNRCILKMDHHCPWLNNCVGHKNYKPFYVSAWTWHQNHSVVLRSKSASLMKADLTIIYVFYFHSSQLFVLWTAVYCVILVACTIPVVAEVISAPYVSLFIFPDRSRGCFILCHVIAEL